MPFMKFYPDSWLYDTRILNHKERAAWIDILCFMWNAPQRGILVGHPEDLARMVGMEWLEFRVVLDGLKTKNVINLTEANEKITLISRRMVREEKHWESNRIRQNRHYKKHQANANLTDKKLEAKKPIKDMSKSEFDFESLWKQYPRREGRKDAERHFRASVKSMNDWEGIQRALSNYLKYLEKNRTEHRFTKMGSTWFFNWQDWRDLEVIGEKPPPTPEQIAAAEARYKALVEREREKMGIK